MTTLPFLSVKGSVPKSDYNVTKLIIDVYVHLIENKILIHWYVLIRIQITKYNK